MAWESELNGWPAVMVIAGTNKMASKQSLLPIAIASLPTTQKHFDWAGPSGPPHLHLVHFMCLL